jgi:hypothetical protein
MMPIVTLRMRVMMMMKMVRMRLVSRWTMVVMLVQRWLQLSKLLSLSITCSMPVHRCRRTCRTVLLQSRELRQAMRLTVRIQFLCKWLRQNCSHLHNQLLSLKTAQQHGRREFTLSCLKLITTK